MIRIVVQEAVIAVIDLPPTTACIGLAGGSRKLHIFFASDNFSYLSQL
jgi:hypothetical protein